MKEILTNLPMKYKIIILSIMLIIIIVVFVLLYKYYYAENDNAYLENETTIENIDSEYNLNSNTNFEGDSNITENQDNKTNSRIGKTKTEKTIIVHVIGEVQNPGVVELEEGSRIKDAIEKAGGKTEEADLSKINLAYIIEDGVQIYVPRIGDDMEKITQISEEAGEGIITQNVKQEDNKNIKVNINTASLEKLQTLPGVGQSTAQKILDYKKENGNFKTIEELKNVSGIGESKFNAIKDYIVVK